MNKFLIVAAPVIAVALLGVRGVGAQVKPGEELSGTIERRHGPIRVQLEIRPYKGIWRNGTWWQEEQYPGENHMLDRLEIWIEDKPVRVPRSAALDLADLDGIQVSGNAKSALIELSGGNDGGMYQVKIKVVNGQVVSREVWDPRWPNANYERTMYKDAPGYSD